ncbi:MAG: 6-phosphogluconolactonase, partial [Anaerolineales bacterium]
VLLGLGADGHTASLFPGTELLNEPERWFAAEFVDKIGGWRTTLTPVAINAARSVAFLVEGKSKAETVQQVIEGDHNPEQWPAQIVEPTDGELHWFMDEAAAVYL